MEQTREKCGIFNIAIYIFWGFSLELSTLVPVIKLNTFIVYNKLERTESEDQKIILQFLSTVNTVYYTTFL